MKMRKVQFFVITLWLIAGMIAAYTNNIGFVILDAAMIIGNFIDKSGYYTDGD